MLLKVDFDSGKTRRHVFGDCPAFAGKIVLNDRIVWFEPAIAQPSENHAWAIWSWRHIGKPTISYASMDAVLTGRLKSPGRASPMSEISAKAVLKHDNGEHRRAPPPNADRAGHFQEGIRQAAGAAAHQAGARLDRIERSSRSPQPEVTAGFGNRL